MSDTALKILRALKINTLFHLMLAIIARALNLFSPYRDGMFSVFHGNPSRSVNLFKAIFRPAILRTRQNYGQWPTRHRNVRLETPLPDDWREDAVDPEIRACYEKLRKDGYIIMPFSFKNEVEELHHRYRVGKDCFEPDNKYHTRTLDLRSDETCMAMMTNKAILDVLALRYGCQPFLRHVALFRMDLAGCGPLNEREITSNQQLSEATSGYALQWHADHPSIIHIEVLMEDIDESGTHMELACGSQGIPFVELDPEYDHCLSTDVVKKAFDVVSLTGKAGSVVLWEGDALHRMIPSIGSYRAFFGAYATPGNHLMSYESRKAELRDGAEPPKKSADISTMDTIVQKYLSTG